VLRHVEPDALAAPDHHDAVTGVQAEQAGARHADAKEMPGERGDPITPHAIAALHDWQWGSLQPSLGEQDDLDASFRRHVRSGR
jgi:hypothetical protein